MKCSGKEKPHASALAITTKLSPTPKDYLWMESLLASTSAKPFVTVDGRRVWLLDVHSMEGHIKWLELPCDL